MSKHTRGPWTVDENEMMSRDIVSAGSRALICTQVYSPDDARLIAAAPELSDTLTKLLSYYIIDGEPSTLPVLGPTDKEILAAWSKARAAIAKATGSGA